MSEHSIKPLESPLDEGMEEFLIALEKHSQAVDPPPHSISSGALSTEDVASDISFLTRQAGSMMGPSSPAYDALGYTTSENLFLGFYSAYKAFCRFVKARRLADIPGMFEEAVAMLRGAAQGLGGATFFGYRSMSIASQVMQAEVSLASAQTLGVATFIVGVIGTLFFTVLYALVGVWSGWQLSRSLKMRVQLNTGDEASQINFLFQQIHSSTKVKLDLLQKKSEEDKKRFKEKLQKTCINEFVFQFLAWQNGALARGEPLEQVFTKDEIRQKFKFFFLRIEGLDIQKAAYVSRYLQQMKLRKEDVEFLGLTPMELCGLKLLEHQRQLRKEARLTRLLGSRAVEQIKKAYQHGLDVRVTEHPTDAVTKEVAEVLQIVREEVDRQILLQGIGTLIGGLGVITTLVGLGFIALPAVVSVGLVASTFLLIALMLGMDMYFLRKGLESGKPGPYDRKFIMVITGIMLASLALAIGLTAGFALPLFPLIMTLLGGGVILGVCAYSYYKLGQLEKKWEEEHPQISHLIEADSHEERMKLYKQLSKEDRNALRDRDKAFYEGSRTTFEHTVEEHISKVEKGASPDLLLRALKRINKQLWAEWHYSDTLKCRTKATEFQDIFDDVQKGGYGALKRLSPVECTELYKNLFVLIKRHELHGLQYTLKAVDEGQWVNVEGDHIEQFQHIIMKEVFIEAFYDFSFDPNGSEDGHYYLGEVPPLFIPHSFSNDPLRESLNQLKKQENTFARMSFIALVKPVYEWNEVERATSLQLMVEECEISYEEAATILSDIRISPMLQMSQQFIRPHNYLFLRQIEKMYQELFSSSEPWLHDELFRAIHAILKPQKSTVKPGANSDLGRALSWAKELDHNTSNRQAEFISNTSKAVSDVIQSMRTLREVIRRESLEEGQAEGIERLKACLGNFKECWDRYINSDNLLIRANQVLLNQQFRKESDEHNELTRQKGVLSVKMSIFSDNDDIQNEYQAISSLERTKGQALKDQIQTALEAQDMVNNF